MRKLGVLLLAVCVLAVGGWAQPEVETMDEEPTCGLTFAQIPKGLTPAQAADRILEMPRPRGRLGFELLDGLVWRYQLTEPYDRVAQWLAAAERLDHRLQFLASLATLGAGRLRDAEERRLEGILDEVERETDWRRLFLLLGRLDEPRFDQVALDHLKRQLDAVGASGEESYSAGVERRNLEALLTAQTFRLGGARQVMRATLALPRQQRLAATAELYAELDSGFSEYLTPWAATRLVRETWGAEPGQQTERSPRPELASEVERALRACLVKSATVLEDHEERLGVKLRLLRTVRHIGGELSVAERAFIEQNNGHHIDLLE